MSRLLFAVFLVVPLLEIAVFIVIGRAVGLWPTLFGVVATAFGGALVLRWQGLSLLQKMRETVAQGQLPGRQIADAMLVGLAGLLLLLPGYVSDFIGLMLLVPPVRSGIYRWLAARFVVTPANPEAQRPPGVIELDGEDWRER